jgi:hypothetical protein
LLEYRHRVRVARNKVHPGILWRHCRRRWVAGGYRRGRALSTRARALDSGSRALSRRGARHNLDLRRPRILVLAAPGVTAPLSGRVILAALAGITALLAVSVRGRGRYVTVIGVHTSTGWTAALGGRSGVA